MIRKNIYSRITESIIQAHRDTTLDSAMDDDGSENMGKKIVAIITADPDQDLDWESEYEPFGATELTADDEQEAMEHEGMESEHDTCPSCGYDVDCEGDECEDDDSEENDDMEDIMIGGGFEDEAEDDYEDMDVKDILVDILQELKGEDSEDESDDTFETSDENPMFGSSDDTEDEGDDEDEDEDEDEDVEGMLEPHNDWASEENSDDSENDDEEDYDDEEDFESPTEDGIETEDYDGMMTSPEQEEVEILDSLDNA